MDAGDSTEMVSDCGSSFANLLMGVESDGICKGDLVSPSPLMDSFAEAPSLWDNPANSQNLGFSSSQFGATAFEKLGLTGLEAPNTNGMTQFPADSAFIDRAARFSCFGTGNISDLVNPFGMMPKNEANPGLDLEEKNGVGNEDTRMAQLASAKGHGAKKRKRDMDQSRRESDEDDWKARSEGGLRKRANGENGKQSSEASDKEEYIHIRARRGQATNSHSLAERVRREKISERMKFLQDLVPGCSKLTGKAVMLDEIINYVQSLQRQVEFLSMKLATVNPALDFDIESLLAKDQMYGARDGPSMGFSADMPAVYQHLHPSRATVIQPNVSVIRPLLTNVTDGYKERVPQVHNPWDGELHTVVQMGFNPSTSPDERDKNSFVPPDHTKVEP